MSGILNSSEFFINSKNVPKWDEKRPFWDQDLNTIQFFREEGDKIKNGVNIGGYHVHPWLYCHLNFFKTPIPVRDENGKDSEVLMCPELDDNILYMIETYNQAEIEELGVCLFGTRGFTKSTMLVSLFFWLALTKANGTNSLVGGSDNDLSVISTLMSKAFNNMHPAIRLPRLITDWDSLVEFGYKYKDQSRATYSQISITNVNGGADSSSEKTAGLSPTGYAMDEIGKYDPRKSLRAALPSFRTQFGAKLVHLLAGTGGNKELSDGAREILENPKAWNLLMMNWDRLDRSVPEKAMDWREDRKRSFGTFVPAHMSYRLDVLKVETTLADYIDMPNDDLRAIKLWKTDWIKAKNRIQELIDVQKKEEDKNKEQMYYPTKIDHCFLTDSNNPFPTHVIERHIRKLREDDNLGKNVEIIKEGSNYRVEFSNKKRAAVSHPGGSIDAPGVLFTDIPSEKPLRDVFISGLDPYKQDVSDTDSLGSLYVLKRRNLAPNEPMEIIQFSYNDRPKTMKEFSRNCLTAIECFNAECCMESADMGFKLYLDERGKTESILCPSFSFSKSYLGNKPRKLNSPFGLPPTTQNNEYRMNLMIEYANELVVIDYDENGDEIIKWGVEFITDIELLEEMLRYRKGGNFDRITGFSHALVYCRELDKKNVIPKNPKPIVTEKASERKAQHGAFSQRRFNPYR